MFIIYLFLIIFVQNLDVINGQEIRTCDESYCRNPQNGVCKEIHCVGKDKMLYKNATTCGCCHKCIKILEEGDPCQLSMFRTLPESVCGPHLKCQQVDRDRICRKISDIPESDDETVGLCERELVDLDKYSVGKPVPECDDFGQYAPKLCRNGTLCHCVDKNGQRIFGSATYDKSDDMDCLCSRQFSEVNDQLLQLNFNIDPFFFVACKSNGNFEEFQVNDDYVYCVNVTEGNVLERAVNKSSMDQLDCKDKAPQKFITNCQKRYINATLEIEKLEAEGHLVVAYDIPKCDIDGTFAPVQCLNKYCFCVNKNGEKYRGTQVNRNEKLSINQQCNCVREMELIRDIDEEKWDQMTELFAQYRCERNGNYLTLQCTESECYCVDPIDGNLETSSKLKTDPKGISELKCYKNYANEFGDMDYLWQTYPDVLSYISDIPK